MMQATDIIHKIRKHQIKSVTFISQRLSGVTTVFSFLYMIQSLQRVGSLWVSAFLLSPEYDLTRGETLDSRKIQVFLLNQKHININTNKIFLLLISLKWGAVKLLGLLRNP